MSEYDTRRAELIEVATRLLAGRLASENAVSFDSIGSELERERVASKYISLAEHVIEKAESTLRELKPNEEKDESK